MKHFLQEFLLEKGYLKKFESPLGELQLENEINGAIIKLQRYDINF